jgi:2-polyprenyl-3-methyl-5-hydroxy-6-metoxy-1,4-benzoquinol methylase
MIENFEHEREFWNNFIAVIDNYMDKRFKYVIDDRFVPLGHPWPDSRKYLFERMGDVRGQKVLDIGTGSGWASVMLAKKGAGKIVAVDMSDKMLAFVNKIAKINGVGDIIETINMPIESAAFEENTFDLIISIEVLHHLNVETAMRKIHGWLKPGGRAVFAEPLANSKLLTVIRDLSPVPKFGTHTERGLTLREITRASNCFSSMTHKEFQLFTRLERVFRKPAFVKMLLAIDSALLKGLPFLRRFARIIIFRCEKKTV